MHAYDAHGVLNNYLDRLSSLQAVPIRDAGELSHPKDLIKSILQHCLRTIADSDQRELLRHAYVSLASFQELSNEQRKALAVVGDIGPLAPPGDERREEQAARLSEVAASLEAIFARLKADTLVLTQELTLLQGANAQD